MPTPTATPAPELPYLTEEIPPCTPVPGSSVNPCEPNTAVFDPVEYPPDSDEPRSLDAAAFTDSSPYVPHLVLRGTYLPGTVRCTSGDLVRPPSYMSRDDAAFLEDSRALKCYVDVRVNAYVIGEGPPILTILWFWYLHGDYEFIFADEAVAEQEAVEESALELDGILSGREEVLFLGLGWDLSSEAWQLLGAWGVERRPDGDFIAVHPQRHLWERYRPGDYRLHRSLLETELSSFTQTVIEAYEALVNEYEGRIGTDPSMPMLVTDAHRLREFFVDVGAYDHSDGPPAQPPPVSSLQ